MEYKFKHNDCENFSPVDAAKGICRLSGNFVYIDTNVCPNFTEIPKCRNCRFFENPDEQEIGVCKGAHMEGYTYGDLKAVTCEGYKVK